MYIFDKISEVREDGLARFLCTGCKHIAWLKPPVTPEGKIEHGCNGKPALRRTKPDSAKEPCNETLIRQAGGMLFKVMGRTKHMGLKDDLERILTQFADLQRAATIEALNEGAEGKM